MEKNVGGVDRLARIVIGIILAVFGIAVFVEYWSASAVIGGVALAIGVILLVTGTTQKCPINDAAGIDTTE